MELIRLILGIILLTMGRRFYWLLLGAAGFVFGFDIAGRFMHGLSTGFALVIGLLAGITVAALAVFLQKLAIIIGGFLAGGYLFLLLLNGLGPGVGHYHWLLFLVGGLAGAVFMNVLFSWALITLSSVLGSALILQALHFGANTSKLLFLFLSIMGIAIQYGLFERKRPRDKPRD